MLRKILAVGALIGVINASLLVNAITSDDTDEWTIFSVDISGNVGRGTSIAIDSNGHPHISYFDYANHALKYARWTGSDWFIETVDSPVAMFNSIAIDSNDRPHIGYMYYSTDPSIIYLKYAVWTGSEWEKSIIDSDRIPGWSVHLALDLNDNPHMSYAVNDNPQQYNSWEGGDIKHAWMEDAIWKIETVETFCWCENSIDISSNNEVCIAFDQLYQTQSSGTYAILKFAKKTNSDWDISTVDPSALRNGAVSLVIGSNDKPHISYCTLRLPEESEMPIFEVQPLSVEKPVRYAYNSILKYACFANDDWELYIVADTEGINGFKNSLALDSSSVPHISYTYYNITSYNTNCDNYQLRYAFFVDAYSVPYWTTCLVHKGSDRYGFHNSLAFDSEDNPHISYYRDHTVGGLMYATKADFTQSPNTPAIPDGPTSGFIGIEYTFSTVTSDSDGDMISYGWDWDGDCIEDEWSNWYNSGSTCNMFYSWQTPGVYNVRVRAKDVYGAISNQSSYLSVEILLSNPPNKPHKPSGSISGRVGKYYTYTSYTTDPDNDQVYYWWEWDDGTQSSWDGPYDSGAQCQVSHKWTKNGTYSVKVKVKDVHGVESEWSEPLSISMPRNKASHFTLFHSLLDQFPMLEKLFSLIY